MATWGTWGKETAIVQTSHWSCPRVAGCDPPQRWALRLCSARHVLLALSLHGLTETLHITLWSPPKPWTKGVTGWAYRKWLWVYLLFDLLLPGQGSGDRGLLWGGGGGGGSGGGGGGGGHGVGDCGAWYHLGVGWRGKLMLVGWRLGLGLAMLPGDGCWGQRGAKGGCWSTDSSLTICPASWDHPSAKETREVWFLSSNWQHALS